MAKSKKPQTKTGGPYLAAAVFCDTVVKGDDGAMSLTRIIDQLTLTLPPGTPAEVPSEKMAVAVEVVGFVSFKTGDAPGKHVIRLVINPPLGKLRAEREHEAEFKKEPNGGFGMRVSIAIPIIAEGVYWMDVILDGNQMTRVPLKVSIKRAETPSSSAAPAKKAAKKSAKKAKPRR